MIMSRLIGAAVLGALLALFLPAPPASAERRLALVIGNDLYRHVEPLRKARGDAEAIGASLKAVGYDVTLLFDADRDAFASALDAFKARIDPGDVVLVHFSGHGVEIDGSNYLLPVDAPRPDDASRTRLKKAAYDLRADLIEPIRERGARVAVFIVDACRDNPYAEARDRSVGGTRGLGRTEAGDGEFILFAAGPRETARDRLSDNDPVATSVFTRVLTKHLTEPGLSLVDMAKRTQREVRDLAATVGHRQFPDYSDRIVGNYALVPPVGGTPAPAVTDPDASMRADFALAERANSAAVWQAFIDRHRTGFLVTLARQRLAALATKPLAPEQVAVLPPPSRPDVGSCGVGAQTVSLTSRGVGGLSGAEERCLKVKDEFRECGDCPAMVVVPAGSFTMGSPSSEKKRSDAEGPQRTVTIAKPFAVAKFTVTVDEFAAFVKATGHDAGSKCWTFENGKAEERSDRSWRNPGFAQSGSHPVACVNWNDAGAYVGWLSKSTGKSYRLLREAEWEFAARGRTAPGSYPRYHYGDDEASMCRHGNGADQTAKQQIAFPAHWSFSSCSDGHAYTAPVGSFTANGFGLFDMHGNVWQWVEDCYVDSYRGAPTDGSAQTTEGCEYRVLRGGSWNNNPRNLRAANRNRNNPDNRNNNNGFRVARTSFAGTAGTKVPAGVQLTFRAVHDETGPAGERPDTAAAPVLAHPRGDRRRRLQPRDVAFVGNHQLLLVLVPAPLGQSKNRSDQGLRPWTRARKEQELEESKKA